MWPTTIRAQTLKATITGIEVCGGSVVQYRGIKYASILERFAIPVPVDSFDGKHLDCTQPPPISPEQPLLDFERVFLAIPETEDVPQLEDWRQDEFECANLIVSVPKGVSPGARIPVFLWIHGGAFIHDSANRRSEDLAKLVSFATQIGKPIIGVSLNFRHHVVGFSTIRGLGNFGLRDQRIGIEWVHKHISDFGGDPNRVTLAGNSSGAVSVHSHLCTAPPGLFQRALMFSSTLGTMEPRNVKQQMYLMKALCKRLDIQWTAGWEDVLERVPIEALMKAYVSIGTNAMYPTADDGFFTLDSEGKVVESIPAWCEALMIGSNENESSLWKWSICSYTTERIISLIKASTSPAVADRLLSAYNIGCPSDSDADTQLKALKFINDGTFLRPLTQTVSAWRSRSKRVFEFLVDEHQPYMPAWGATHDGNLFYALGPFDLSASDNKTAQRVQHELQRKLIHFVYGGSPWNHSKRFAFGPSGTCGEIDNREYMQRRRIHHCQILSELDQGELLSAMDTLIRGAARQPMANNARL